MDQYSHGFAATESGIEIRIPDRVFTEEEAREILAGTSTTRHSNPKLFFRPGISPVT
jgi:hypothetical protein